MTKFQPLEELETISLKDEDTDKLVYVGSQFQGEIRIEVVECLQANADVFAWTLVYMLGINFEVISHYLNVDLKMRPIEQKNENITP